VQFRLSRSPLLWIFRLFLNASVFLLAAFHTEHAAQAQNHLRSSAEIRAELKRLRTVASVLYIAAHPDDENTRFISKMAAGQGVRTAYLSLTRGSGGQNLLGAERGDLLGVIRTFELLAARGVDFGQQFFSSAIDFGYAKSAEDALAIWGEEAVLEDVVWAMRTFKPDIVVTRFEPDSRGHGHHKASAILAHKAYREASKSSFAADQLKFVEPWTAHRIIYNKSTWFKSTSPETRPNVAMDLGGYNSELGITYSEVAARSRSMHKSQGFGTAPTLGKVEETFVHIDGEVFSTSIFDGIDTSWSRFSNGEQIASRLEKLIEEFNSDAPWQSIDELLELRESFAALEDSVWREYYLNKSNRLLKSMLGLRLKLISPTPSISPGKTIEPKLLMLNNSPVDIQVSSFSFNTNKKLERIAKTLGREELLERKFALEVPLNTPYSVPHWLRKPKSEARYTLNRIESHLAIDNPMLSGVLEVSIKGRNLRWELPLEYMFVDPIRGEITSSVAVVPALSVTFSQDLYVATPQKNEVELNAIVKSSSLEKPLSGSISLDLPKGWKAERASQSFNLRRSNEQISVRFNLRATKELIALDKGPQTVTARVNTGSKSKAFQVRTINYEHIPAQVVVEVAKTKLLAIKAKTSSQLIGYIDGAGDDVPETLRALGIGVELLTAQDLNAKRLGRYSAIVTGVRALNTHSWLLDSRELLLNYVEQGGTLVLQYNTNNRLAPLETPIGPYPYSISRDRVVEESALVTRAPESHPLFVFPNRISAKDFDDWVQERGLYFATNWDTRYETPLSMHDKGEAALKGSLLYTRYGKGRFIYTGLSFFRQLPAGVPGAIRIFLNMVSKEQLNK
jgi:LmbE family N-acetylglucosaminyl deacetylase/predicted DNA binding CopG/RHH family protein